MSDNIIQLNEDLIKHDLKDLVRSSVEETLNALLDKEADELVNAQKYERSTDRQGYRSSHYKRIFQTAAGDVELKVPKLKGVSFETAIIERYRRRESSVEEALIEMYLAGVSVRRVEDITETLWGTKVSPGTISNLNKKAYEHIETWRTRPLVDSYPYVYVDGVYLKRSWGGEIQNVSILVAIGVSNDGCREIIGAAEGMKENKESWRSFFVWLKERGLTGVRLIIGDKNLGMLETIPDDVKRAREYMCRNYFDVRTFGAVMSTGEDPCGIVRGPVQINFARSISPVNILEVSITRQARTTEERTETGETEMGRKSVIPYALYRAEGYVSAALANKSTGLSEDDLELLWSAIINMFENDHSAARGKMCMRKLYIFKHSNVLGNCPSHLLFDKIAVSEKEGILPRSFTDYEINVDRQMPEGVELIEKI
jgi:CRISPR-associated protein Cas7/Csd2 subtype I-C